MERERERERERRGTLDEDGDGDNSRLKSKGQQRPHVRHRWQQSADSSSGGPSKPSPVRRLCLVDQGRGKLSPVWHLRLLDHGKGKPSPRSAHPPTRSWKVGDLPEVSPPIAILQEEILVLHQALSLHPKVATFMIVIIIYFISIRYISFK
ncbi:unnamed protein product [Spirodela intermedia]|uniref:Uncharacterized protein n=1 Tax=Spirodela intermedia TaxID=51605 RepID=A0A7I8I932_SPIIN|nr:unnamed protein product [Spirodela intermedia]CAA6653994.1 unnamed protein product [Spirodela intermedia]